ncbi:MAG: hypothetical protein LBS96_02200 [Oscillospiraceae bacterium]|nr:hypothetical protein [Oscillospiraceae bacterium]
MLDLGQYYNDIFGFINPIFDWITDFINTYVAGGFDLLLTFILGMGL